MKRLILRIFCFIVILFAVFYILFFPVLFQKEEQTVYEGILRLWNIDSFEGGKGSRGSFLSKVAKSFEKTRNGVYIMVNSYTQEGVAEALKNGEYPDMVSFSCGLDGIAEICRELSFSFGGGEIGGKNYAYPWCAGQYYFFCQEDDFSSISSDNLLISEGGNNLPAAAAALCGIRGEVKAEDSTSAYVDFLKGKYRYMLGTQRDVCRFASRQVNVYTMPVSEYADLFQYIAVTAKDDADAACCYDFLSLLFSDEVQSTLSGIGMYPMKEVNVQSTLSAFVERNALSAVRGTAEEALVSGDTKILKSYLKSLN